MPDVVFNTVFLNYSIALLKAYVEGGYKVPLMAGDTFRRRTALDVLGDSANGQEGTSPLVADTTLSGDIFKRELMEATNLTPSSYDPQAYDAVAVVLLAALIASQPLGDPTQVTPVQIRDAMKQGQRPRRHGGAARPRGAGSRRSTLIAAGKPINYEGASGTCDFDANRTAVGKIVRWKVENRRFNDLRAIRLRQGQRLPAGAVGRANQGRAGPQLARLNAARRNPPSSWGAVAWRSQSRRQRSERGADQGGSRRAWRSPSCLCGTWWPFPRPPDRSTSGRARSIRLIESLPAVQASRMVALALQRNPADEDPPLAALHEVATLAQVVHVARSRRDGMGYLVVVATHKRLRLLSETAREPYLRARVETLDDLLPRHEDPEYLGLRDSVKKLFGAYIEKAGNIASEVIPVVAELEDAAILTDVVAATLPSLETPRRQILLETLDVRERLRMLIEELIKENDKLDLERRLQDEIRSKVQGAQRESAAARAAAGHPAGAGRRARRRLGDRGPAQEGRRGRPARERADGGGPRAGSAAADRRAGRPSRRWCATTSTGWSTCPGRASRGAEIDLARAEQILDEDHYGLTKVKQRILEYLAVLRLRREIRAPSSANFLLLGTTRGGQDLAGAIDRPGAGARLRPAVAGRDVGRGRAARPPPHVHRGHARPDHPGPPARR